MKIDFHCDRCGYKFDPCESALCIRKGFIEANDFADLDKTLDDVMFGWDTSLLCHPCRQELAWFMRGAKLEQAVPIEGKE